jgi:hypothetical protein
MLAVTESKLRMQDRMTEASSKPTLTQSPHFQLADIIVAMPYTMYRGHSELTSWYGCPLVDDLRMTSQCVFLNFVTLVDFVLYSWYFPYPFKI